MHSGMLLQAKEGNYVGLKGALFISGKWGIMPPLPISMTIGQPGFLRHWAGTFAEIGGAFISRIKNTTSGGHALKS